MKETLRRGRALLVCAPMLAAACGSGDEGAADEATATSAIAAAAEADSGGSDDGGSGGGLGSSSGDDAAGSETETDGAVSLAGRTGPIREMPIFAPWADQDLKTFLTEVMLFPAELPVPEDAVLTYASHNQSFREDGGSTMGFSAHYQPMFDRDWFRENFATLVDSNVWEIAEVDEDLEDNETRLEFSSKDPEAELRSFWITYADGDAQKQPKLNFGTSGGFVETRNDVVINGVLFGWADDVVVPESAWNSSVSVSIQFGVQVDRRWDLPADQFEATQAFVEDGGSSGLTVGEVDYSDNVWPLYRTDVTAPDWDFDGTFSVGQTDPEDDVYLNLIGSLAESQ